MKYKSMHDVIQFSEKIVECAYEIQLPISNLQLQKILYYLQGNYMKEFGKKAFSDLIECWEYGPVVQRAWKMFSYYGREPIKNFGANLKISDKEKNLIIDILKKNLTINIWDLVEKTHNEIPWKQAYESHSRYISDASMEQQFCI